MSVDTPSRPSIDLSQQLLQCPHCQQILNHLLLGQLGEPIRPLMVDRAAATAVASGDLVDPRVLPRIAKAFELVQEGADRQYKQEGHHVHMAAPPPDMAGRRRRKRPSKEIAKVPPPVPTLQLAQAVPGNSLVLDHPKIGGKVTVCVLLYGDFASLHRRCLTSIISTIPAGRLDLRVAGNEVCQETQKWVETLPINRLYLSPKNRLKYPQMRAMFHDRNAPLETKYVLWFDDDSYVRDPHFLEVLARLILSKDEQEKVGQFGHKMYHKLGQARSPGNPQKWLEQGTWWKGRHLQDKLGRPVPNGQCLHFCVGGFWAMSTEAILACDIPDVRLSHNGGDILCSQQLYQNGYNMVTFNDKKQFVHTSAAPRRGFSEKFPWYA